MRSLGLMSLTALILTATPVLAEEIPVPLQKAQGEDLSAAMGHFGRTRSLLVAAINEFDQGLKVVNPDALLDTAAWRKSVMERATELERVLDPQPRASRGGVKYDADTRLLKNVPENKK